MMNENLFSNCFDAMVKCFAENNQGTNSQWSWDDAFKMRRKAFDMLWNGQISHSQYDRFSEAISVPLFDHDKFVEDFNRRAKASSDLFNKLREAKLV